MLAVQGSHGNLDQVKRMNAEVGRMTDDPTRAATVFSTVIPQFKSRQNL